MVTKPAQAEIRERLARLQELKVELDSFDATLGKLVPDVEAVFASLRLGVSISMEIDEKDYATQYLSFTKVGKQWRLCVEWVGDPTQPRETTPVSDLPRDERAQICLHHLPNMLVEAVTTMERKIQQRRLAIESTKHLIDTVSTVTADDSPLGTFGIGTVTQVNAADQAGMKVSVDMPKEAYDAIKLSDDEVRAWAGKSRKPRLIINGKKREKIADGKKSETIMGDDGEDE